MWEMQSLQASRVLKSVSGLDFQWKETQTAATRSYCDFTAQQCWTSITNHIANQHCTQSDDTLPWPRIGLPNFLLKVGKPGECD